jgi:steroid delta-isomerase-like uncharacterized protein
MTTHLATYAEIIRDAWNSHDIEKVLSFYSPEYVGDDVGQASLLRGHKSLRSMLEQYWRAFPDLRFKIVSTLVEGNRLAITWVGEGTHQGTILNIPPTGHKVESRGVSILEVQDGLVVHGQSIRSIYLGPGRDAPSYGVVTRALMSRYRAAKRAMPACKVSVKAFQKE